MKRNKMISVSLILLMATSVVLPGCSGLADNYDGEKVVNIGLSSSPNTMDPQIVTDVASAQMVDNYCGKLYRYDYQGDLVPDLAVSYDVSDDGLEWTYNIDENARWSNGDPVTADDFVFAMQRIADPSTGSGSIYVITNYCLIDNAYEIYNGECDVNELGVFADDDHTLRFVLEEPCPYFPSLITLTSFAPCNRNFFYSCNGHYCESPEYMLSSGPFVVDRYEPLAAQIHYSKNPEYVHRDNVEIDGINFFSIANTQQGYMCFDIGQLDITPVNGELLDMIGTDDSRLHYSSGSIMYLSFNFRSEAINNINIRRALIRSIDRQSLATNVIRSGASPMTRLVSSGFYIGETEDEYNEQTKYFDNLCSYDQNAAKDLWAQGTSELGQTHIKLRLAYNSSTHSSVVEVLQDQWKRTLPDLEIEFVPMTPEQWVVALDGGDYDMIVGGWAPDYVDPTAFLNIYVTNQSATSPLFSDETYDGLLEQAATPEMANDFQARNEVLHQAEQYLADQAAYVPLVFTSTSVMVSDDVNEFATIPAGLSYIMQDFRLEEAS